MNRYIILGRDWLKQFDVYMNYDLGCLKVGKSYIKVEEDSHISFWVRLSKETVISPQTGKLCMCKVNRNPKLLSSKLPDVLATKDSVSRQEPGLLAINSIIKRNRQGRYPMFLLNNTNKSVNLKKVA